MGASGGHVVLLQFTGVKDKDGNQIYEGDIITNDAHLLNPKTPILVEWQSYCSGFGLGQSYSPQLKIIGNIYENPELLTPTMHANRDASA